MVNTYIYLYVLIIPIRLCFKTMEKAFADQKKNTFQCK
nr:MAG TPA_asm: hypothetical protein [Caudoviricetes sp.]